MTKREIVIQALQHKETNPVPYNIFLTKQALDKYQTFQPEVYDIVGIKALYGDKLSFWGGISTQQCLPQATPKEVKKEAVRIFDALHKNGGLIIAPTHSVEFDVSPENILALLDVFQNQDKYFFRKNVSE